MNRVYLILCLTLVLASLVFVGTSRAVEDPAVDYCTQRAEACIAQCDQHNIHLWGVDIPTPRTVLCLGECSTAYVGCILMRFRLGV